MDHSRRLRGRGEFATTHWSLVQAAKGSANPAEASRARRALAALCEAYWYPLYVFVRGRGQAPQDAQDLTQEFFARLIDSDGLSGADRDRGRFRSYLLGALKNFLANEWHRARTQKRGGNITFLNWDALDPEARFALELPQGDNPDRWYDRGWAREIVSRAFQRLRSEQAVANKIEQFEALKGSLSGMDYACEAASAGLNLSEGALKVAVHRLRKRYRELLVSEVEQTVCDPAEVEEEMRYLLSVLRGL